MAEVRAVRGEGGIDERLGGQRRVLRGRAQRRGQQAQVVEADDDVELAAGDTVVVGPEVSVTQCAAVSTCVASRIEPPQR